MSDFFSFEQKISVTMSEEQLRALIEKELKSSLPEGVSVDSISFKAKRNGTSSIEVDIEASAGNSPKVEPKQVEKVEPVEKTQPTDDLPFDIDKAVAAVEQAKPTQAEEQLDMIDEILKEEKSEPKVDTSTPTTTLADLL